MLQEDYCRCDLPDIRQSYRSENWRFEAMAGRAGRLRFNEWRSMSGLRKAAFLCSLFSMVAIGKSAGADCGPKGCGSGYCFPPDPKGPPKASDCQPLCDGSQPPCNSCPYDHTPYCRYDRPAADFIALKGLKKTYDYIIVGGGASGSALAATLADAKNGVNVLLLESGLPQDAYPDSTTELTWPTIYRNTTAAIPLRTTDGPWTVIPNVLGGGTAMNAGIYLRAPNSYFTRARANNSAAFKQADVDKAYEWVEETDKHIVFNGSHPLPNWAAAVSDALHTELGLPLRGSTVHWPANDSGIVETNRIFDPCFRRHSAARLLERPNLSLTVLTEARARTILFDSSNDKKAVGITFLDSTNASHMVNLRPGGELIISAGSLNTPKVLMLNGIGPAAALSRLGIKPRLNLPVGEFIKDPPLSYVALPLAQCVDMSIIRVVGVDGPQTFFEPGSGGKIFLQYLAASGGIVGPSQRTPEFMDLLHSLTDPELLPEDLQDVLNQGGQISTKVLAPASTGKYELTSASWDDPPKVTMNYFKDPESVDLKQCAINVKKLSDVTLSKALKPWRVHVEYNPLKPWEKLRSLFQLPQVLPGVLWAFLNKQLDGLLRQLYDGTWQGTIPNFPDFNNTEAVHQWCRTYFVTAWHQHGTAVINDVVDPVDFSVKGASNLRVVDGSIWRESPSTNPQATNMMLGRLAGNLILETRKMGGKRTEL